MYSYNNDKQPVAGASPPTCALHDNNPSCL